MLNGKDEISVVGDLAVTSRLCSASHNGPSSWLCSRRFSCY